jgi:hypothetical protein
VLAGVSNLTPGLGLLALLVAASGCYATAGAYTDTDADYVDADYVPTEVEAYPQYVYGGRTVYLVNGHWYYRRGPRWVYYRAEPGELRERRAYFERDRARHRVEPREAERREAYRHEAEPREAKRRDSERREAEPREAKRREAERRDSERRADRHQAHERREHARDHD